MAVWSIAHAAAAAWRRRRSGRFLFGLLAPASPWGPGRPALGSLAALGGHRLPVLPGRGLGREWTAAPVPGGGRSPSCRRWRRPSGRPAVQDAAGLAAGGSARRLLAPSGLLGRSLLAVAAGGDRLRGFEATFVLLGRGSRRAERTVGRPVFAGVGVVLSVVQAVLVKKVIGRLGATRTARSSVLVTTAGFLLLVPALGWAGLVPALVALTVGQGLLNPSMATIVSTVTPEERRGQVFGVQQAVGAASRILGPLSATALFALAVPAPYVAGAALAVVGALALLTLPVEDRAPVPAAARASGH
ncbi:MAG: MFS transporter [Acidimicrobiales bacterium]